MELLVSCANVLGLRLKIAIIALVELGELTAKYPTNLRKNATRYWNPHAQKCLWSLLEDK